MFSRDGASVERALQGVDEGTVEADALRAEAMRLRDEYQALIAAARRKGDGIDRRRHREDPEPHPATQ